MKELNVSLRLNDETFKKISNGEIKHICHGFSNNKKYTRLFENNINLTLKNCDKTHEIKVEFDSIEIIHRNNKKLIKINLK